jgi:uncharacterized cupredoxin-like copper-binding protein
MRSRVRMTSAALLCALALSACSLGGSGGVKVDLDEFSLNPSVSRAQAGSVQFTVHNLGAVAHEFIVLRTNRPVDRLPVKNGFVRLEAKDMRVVRSIRQIQPGALKSETVTLRVGRYALICNVVGHYQSGMHAAFRVT